MIPDIQQGFYNLSLLTDGDLDEVFIKPQQGIYFLPARTGKGWFHQAISKSACVLFLRADTESSVLIAVGSEFAKVLESQKVLGFLVRTQRD